MVERKTKLPIYLPTELSDGDREPCDGCNLKDYRSNCRFQPMNLFTKEGVSIPDKEKNERIDLIVVADVPSFDDNKASKFWASESGSSLLRRIKKLRVENFAVIPAVRCYAGGDIEHNVMTKKYKGSSKFTERETPLIRATKAVANCKVYVRRAISEYNPRFILAMGPLAATAMDLAGSIQQLRTQPIRPKPGLKNANQNEGIIVTYDRFEAVTNDWAFRDLQRDLEKIEFVRNTGFANPRGNDKNVTIKTLGTVTKVKKFVDWMLTTEFDPQEVMCIDFETENMDLSTETNRLLNVGISRSCDEDVAYVIPLAHPETPFAPDELVEVYAQMKRLFRSEGASFYGWCGHNTQFEVTMVKLFFDEWLGEGGGVKTLDTMVLAYILDEDRSETINRPYSLETLAQEMLDFRWYGQSAMKSKRDRLSSEPIADVNTYVGYDAIVTARLINELLVRMTEEGSDRDLLRLATKLYGPAIHYTVDLKLTGQYIDVDLLRMLRAPNSSIVHRLREIEEEFSKAPEVGRALGVINQKAHGGSGMAPVFKTNANKTFSLTSQEHRAALFWDILELDGADESVDKKFQERHKGNKLVDMFSEYQQLSKLDSSYLKPLADWLQSPNSTDGRVRPNFNLVNTRTGRLSASEPNCYDDQTEILTQRGWVPFPELLDGDEVAQWWPDGNIDFVKPNEVVRQKYDGDMVRLKNQHIDLLVTPNHRCPLRHRKSGKLKVVEAKSYQEDYKQHHAGIWKGGSTSISQHLISLVCAAQADGSWRSDVRQAMELSFSKKRKIERLRDALLKANAVFTERPKGSDSTRFYVSDCPALQYVMSIIGRKKEFPVEWLLSLDRESLDMFVDEINHWDGCFTRNNQYTSTVKNNVDVVQIAMTLSDLRATVNRHSSTDTTAWALYQTQRNYSMTTNVEKVNLPYDGSIYCVAVPSSFVVVRRNGFTAICGNTQQMPRSDSTAKKQIKGMFKSAPGKVMVQLDFSQAEVRWLGILSGDEALAQKYKMADELEAALLKDPNNEDLKKRRKIDGDLHMSTAITMYKLNKDIVITDEKTAKIYRQRAKACVHPDTLIGLNGELRHVYLGMKEAAGADPADGGIHKLSGVSVWDGEGHRIPALAVHPLIQKRGVHVVTRRGALTCSYDHMFKLADGRLVDAQDLKPGDIPADTQVPVVPEKPYPVIRHRLFNGTPPVVIELNDDVAYFAGMYTGDGCRSGHAASIAHGPLENADTHGVTYKEWQAIIMDAASRIGLEPSSGKKAVYLGHRHTQRYLEALGLLTPTKKSLRIPDWVTRSGKTAICHFLAGLIDTDGTVDKKTGMVSFTTKDVVLVGQAAAAARSCGLRIGVEPCWNKTYEKYYYRMRIMANDAFSVLKPFIRHPGKSARLRPLDVKCQAKNQVLLVQEAGDIPCLDISVGAEDHLYMTNGLLTHNTCFGLIYGKAAKSLAKDLGIDEEEAQEAVDLWLSQFPKAAEWLTSMEDFAVQYGYVKSAFGRWRRLPEAQSGNMSVVNRAKRQSRNTPIQSAASDGCIYAACRLRDELRFSDDPKVRSIRLINTVHDSIIAEVPADADTIRTYANLAKAIFTDRNLLKKDFDVDVTVPLAVDFDIGLNWGNMTDYDFTEVALHRALHDAEVLRGQPPGTLLSDLKGKGLLFDEHKK